jgi:hypothetical protein
MVAILIVSTEPTLISNVQRAIVTISGCRLCIVPDLCVEDWHGADDLALIIFHQTEHHEATQIAQYIKDFRGLTRPIPFVVISDEHRLVEGT